MIRNTTSTPSQVDIMMLLSLNIPCFSFSFVHDVIILCRKYKIGLSSASKIISNIYEFISFTESDNMERGDSKILFLFMCDAPLDVANIQLKSGLSQ